jgi:hypothetical protein
MGVSTKDLQDPFVLQMQQSNKDIFLMSNSKTILTSLSPNMNLHKTTHIFFHSLTKLNIFCSIGSIRWKAKNVLLPTKTKEQCVTINLL